MTRLVGFGVTAGSSALWRAQGWEAANTTEGWQDKSAHIARRSGGCSFSIFWRVANIARHWRNVRGASNPLYLPHLFHIAAYRHG
jgi:hypothetical protein